MKDVSRYDEPVFRDPSEITEEMRDPDYALKQLAKLNNGVYTITCSKCHDPVGQEAPDFSRGRNAPTIDIIERSHT